MWFPQANGRSADGHTSAKPATIGDLHQPGRRYQASISKTGQITGKPSGKEMILPFSSGGAAISEPGIL
jgi:hypothetical protein